MFRFSAALVVAGAIFVVVGWASSDPLVVRALGDSPSSEATIDTEADFARDVLPILSGRCFECHGPDRAARKGGLALHVRDRALAATRSGGVAIVPGDLTASELLERVRDRGEDRMPPPSEGDSLTRHEIAILERWIAAGAEYATHWAFVPPRDHPLPPTISDPWVANEIDAWILARLRHEQLEPSPLASPSSLIRRVALDLTGLPPSIEQVRRYTAEPTEQTYLAIVDELLTSDGFGERWASVWLDLARYADTKGYEKDARRTIWPYRDWVIRAFDRDLPFDQFTIEQLAGDLLPKPTSEQLVATAFHRNTMTNDEGGTDNEEFRVAAVVDRVNTTWQVWLGLTMACAQCHDHKYDPISQDEYYAFYDIWNQTQDADRNDDAPLHQVMSPSQAGELAAIDRLIAEIKNDAATDREKALAHQPAWESSLAGMATAPDTSEVEWQASFDAADRSESGASAPRVVPGLVGDAAEFAAGRHLDLGSRGDFERDQPFSFGGWIRLDGDRVHVPIARMDNTDDYRGWDLYIHDRRAYVHLIHRWPDNTALAVTRGALPLGEWFHLFVTVDGSSRAKGIKIYVNGAPMKTRATHDTLTGSIVTDKSLQLGRRFSERDFHGALDEWRLEARAVGAGEVRDLALSGVASIARRSSAERSEAQAKLVRDVYLAVAAPNPLRKKRELIAEAQKQRSKLVQAPSIPILRAVAEGKQRTTRVMRRGSFLDLGEPVTAAVPSIFEPLPSDSPPRLALARWLVDGDNPLTARVWVNRIWEQLFGRGLVASSEDFGVRGSPPSHPELLDDLALGLVADGWSTKRLLRRIVTSSTYRQSSRVRPEALDLDPRNVWLARGARFRLPAETIRDQALFVSGLLGRRKFGPPAMPPQPDGVWQIIYSGDRWEDAEGPERFRRAIYTFWRRTSPYPSAVTFDAPSREVCVVRRIPTNTPLQALTTLNDPVFVEAAQALGRRASLVDGDVAAQMTDLFERALLRGPSELERSTLEQLLASELVHYRAHPDAARALRTLPMEETAETDYPLLAAWTVVANVVLNLDEFLTKG